jgi:hypothetical protein
MVRLWQKWPALMPYTAESLTVSAQVLLKYVMDLERIKARGEQHGR